MAVQLLIKGYFYQMILFLSDQASQEQTYEGFKDKIKRSFIFSILGVVLAVAINVIYWALVGAGEIDAPTTSSY